MFISFTAKKGGEAKNKKNKDMAKECCLKCGEVDPQYKEIGI